jgi:ketosteroid isomerase-like protein
MLYNADTDRRLGMDAGGNVQLVMDAFRAVETRDNKRLVALYHPDIKFHWPPSLRYGARRADAPGNPNGTGWSDTWESLQPTEAERSMSPRVIGANDREVAVLWHQRGKAPDGEGIDTPVLGLYEVREGKLARAQMFYFDPVAVGAFLERAEGRAVNQGL